MRFLLAIICLFTLAVVPAHADDGLTLQSPVDGRVLKGFDPGPTRYSPGHRGVDLEAPAGSAVRAAAPGQVYFAGTVAGRPSVSVDHGGGLRTTYTPVVAKVAKGQVVAAGDVLGTLQAGHCEQSCLHFGLTDGEDYHDPMSYLETRRVRLVPMGSRPVVRASLPGATVPGDTVLGPPGKPGAAPVQGRMTSPFGMRKHPVTGIYKLHDGTDFGAPCGTPIRSPWAGTVVKTDVSRGYGYRVHVRHDGGLTTAYAHLPRFDVKVGQRVAAGGQVGVVGNTGYSTGCHLHWMAWQGGKLVNPMTLLR